MKKYVVTVNGTSYEVMVDEVSEGGAAPAQAAAAAVSAAAVPQAPAPAPAPAAQSSEGGEKVSAPMPGTILRVNVKAGDSFKKGDVLLVLEAMKMENDITAPKDGTVAGVSAAQGASVNTGDVLLTYNA